MSFQVTISLKTPDRCVLLVKETTVKSKPVSTSEGRQANQIKSPSLTQNSLAHTEQPCHPAAVS